MVLLRYCSKVLAYKLVDVPELGYTAADQPNPRGELRIKTRNMIGEYYKDPKVRCCVCSEQTLHFLLCVRFSEQSSPSALCFVTYSYLWDGVLAMMRFMQCRVNLLIPLRFRSTPVDSRMDGS